MNQAFLLSTLKALSFTLLSLLILSGCESDTKTTTLPPSDTAADEAVILRGAFIDNQVAGLRYRTATREGFTDENGLFEYVDGEVVTFSIGAINFPSVVAKSVITPLDLAGTSEINEESLNIARFLQSLDSDNNLENGIQISQITHEQLTPADFAAFTFASGAEEFELESAEVFQALPSVVELVSEESASLHLQASIDALNNETEVYTVREIYKSNILNLTDQTLNEDAAGVLIKLQEPSTEAGVTAVYSIKSLDESIFPEKNVTLESNHEGTMLALTPAANSFGTGRFILTEMNGPVVRTRVFKVDVESINDTPNAHDRSLRTTLNTEINDSMLGFASDIDDETLSFEALTLPEHGSLSLDSNGSFKYVPKAGFSGEDQFSYLVRDSANASAQASVHINITGLIDRPNENDAPIALTSSFATSEDQSFSDRLSAQDIEGDSLRYQLVRDGSNGTVILDEAGFFSYTPTPDTHGEDSFTYIVNDGQLDSEVATIYISVASENDAPHVTELPNQSLTVGEQLDDLSFALSDDETPASELTILVISSNNEVIDAEQITLGGDSLSRTLSISAEGSTPGTAEITLVVSDGEFSSETHFAVTVLRNNVLPTSTAVQHFSSEDSPTQIDLSPHVADEDGDSLEFTIIESPEQGSYELSENGILSYTPEPNYAGTVQFSYQVSDGRGLSNISTIQLSIAEENDAPVAMNDTASTIEDTPVDINVLANDYDIDSVALSISNLVALNGSASIIESNLVRYTPNSHYNGSDTLTYLLSDGEESASASVTIDITPVNDEPEASSSSFTLIEDGSLTGTLLASDIDSAQLTYRIEVAPELGELTISDTSSGTFTYIPYVNANGSDNFSFVVNDGENDSNIATVDINLIPEPDEPIANSDTLIINEDTSGNVNVLTNDINVDSGSLRVVNANANNGSTVIASPTNGIIQYQGNPDYHGTDVITYTIENDQGYQATGIVNVIVNPIDDDPYPLVDEDSYPFYVTEANEAISFSVADTIFDPDNDVLNFSINDAAGRGDFELETNGTVTFFPEPNTVGYASLYYMATDGEGEPAYAQVSIQVILSPDLDADSDDIANTHDNCPFVENYMQRDADLNGVGNACETLSTLTFSDANLQSCINDHLTNNNGIMAGELTSLDCSNRGISNVAGIERLSNLQHLDISDNNITWISLPTLDNLESINVRGNTNLIHLNLAGNRLSSIDLSSNTQLEHLDLGHQYVEASDIRPERYINNQITNIDLSGLTQLNHLDLSNNPLSDIDLSNQSLLTHLSLWGCGYDETLDLSALSQLRFLDLTRNNISQLNLTSLTQLQTLNLNENKLSNINLSNQSLLTGLALSQNRLSTIDLSVQTELSWLYLEDNQLSHVNLVNQEALGLLNLAGNDLDTVDLSAQSGLSILNLSRNNIANIDLSALSLLSRLEISDNQLRTIDLASDSVDYLDIRENPLLESTKSYLDEQNIEVLLYSDNSTPIADAGENQYHNTSESVTVTLDGSSSLDNDGTIVSYSWVQIVEEDDSSVVSLSNPETSTASFTAQFASPQTLEFELTVTDNQGSIDSDIIAVQLGSSDVVLSFDTEQYEWPIDPISQSSAGSLWQEVSDKAYAGPQALASSTPASSEGEDYYCESYDSYECDTAVAHEAMSKFTAPTLGGVISFWYSVSSEEDFDFLEFYIDGELIQSWSGEIDWTQAVYDIAPGIHEFSFVYRKDGSVDIGSDKAWIDSIIFPVDHITDTDKDGLSDATEFLNNTDPYDSDSDNDGLSDHEEINTFGTNPLEADSDGDGISDAKEIAEGSNPLEPEFPIIDVPAISGYTLIAPVQSNETLLIEADGTVAHSWLSDTLPGMSVYLLESGELLRAGKVAQRPDTFAGTANGSGGLIEILDGDSNVIWSVTLATDSYLAHHDIEVLPNGNILAVVWEARTADEARSLGRVNILDDTLWADAVYEICRESLDNVCNDGEIVWSWSAWDHIAQDVDDSIDSTYVSDLSAHPDKIDINYASDEGLSDWTHINAIDYNASTKQILLSVPNFNEYWIIEHDDTNSGITSRVGNPSAYGASGEQSLFFQHDAQWIDEGYPGSGNILVFNNGRDRPEGEYSSVDEFCFNGIGCSPGERVSSYSEGLTGEFYASYISGAQRLESGNTLVCEGPEGRIFEYNSDHEVIWEYTYPDRLFRATRINFDHPGLSELSGVPTQVP